MSNRVDAASLPAVVTAYLEGRAGATPTAVVDLFAPDGVVVDDGSTYRGPDQIGAWIARSTSGSEYEYTTTFLGAEQDGEGITVTNRIEGNFPGGLVDLRYRFVLTSTGELIRELTIAP